MARTQTSGLRAAVKGGARCSKAKGGAFKDAPRPRSSRMVRSYIEPVEVAPVESMDTGATTLSAVVPRAIPKSGKADIGKIFPTTDRTPVIDTVNSKFK